MSVFDGEVKIGRTVKDPGSDHSLPPGGSLSFGAVKSVSALSGTTGVDACLITGNKWQQLNGKHTENVTMDHLLQILGNRQELVSGNHTHMIIGNTNTTHIGTHNQTNVAPRNEVYGHKKTETHSEQEFKQQPTGQMKSINSEHKDVFLGFELYQQEKNMYGMKMEFTGLNVEGDATNVESKAINVEIPIVHHECKLLEDKLHTFATDVVAVKIRAAEAHLKAIAADLNAGLAANADSPFA